MVSLLGKQVSAPTVSVSTSLVLAMSSICAFFMVYGNVISS